MIRLLTENLGWKLLSLLLALLLWLAVVGGPELTSSITVPVVFRNLPKDLEISSDFVERARLEIRGSASRLNTENLSSAAVVLDLASVSQPGERTFTISEADAALPAGVTLQRAMPAQLRLHFERRVWRDTPVRVRYAAPPPVGYTILRQEVDPPRLVIVGPESRVNQIDHVETDPIDPGATVDESAFHVHAYSGDPHVRFETRPVVSVKLKLEKIPRKGTP